MLSRKVPEYFQNKELRLILFGGKGGVGKTTLAATAAVHLARSHYKDKRVMVISTDPAHSLGDSFGIEIGDRVTPIQWSVVRGQRSEVRGQWAGGRGQTSEERDQSTINNQQSTIQGLFARELDAGRLADEFKQKNEAVIKKLADRGTYFDREDISEFFDLSLPGMDEVMAIIEMADLIKEGACDVLIVDTAPTGHTVRMLALPDQMQKWIGVMDLMQQKHRYMAAHFTGKKYVKDECDIFLDNLSSDIDRVKKLLSNRETTRFVPVTIPEPMSIYETERLVGSLKKMGLPVKEIIVNRVVDTDECPFCASKREDQRQPLTQIEDTFSEYELIKVPLFPREVRKVEGLKNLADYLLGIPKPAGPTDAVPTGEEPRTCFALDPNLEFFLFGGKGGVGKTSLASATALHLARQKPEKRILVFSTDPAHSLSDSLNQPIGDKITAVQWSASGLEGPTPRRVVSGDEKNSAIRNPQSAIDSNLFALEIDADKLWEDFKEEFKHDIEEMFDKFLGNKVDIKFDREVMTELLTLAPPGLDEIMALDTIMALREKGEFDVLVLDTSPTGHLLRFLELPDKVREWLRAFFRLLLKYKGVVRLTKAAEKALSLSRNVRRIQETLVDSQRTAFVGVTIPEAMGFLELERLAEALDNAGIPCDNIAINLVIPKTDCTFCSSMRAEQLGYIKKIRSRFPGRSITRVPLLSHQVRGIHDLGEIGQIIFGKGQ